MKSLKQITLSKSILKNSFDKKNLRQRGLSNKKQLLTLSPRLELFWE